MHVRVRLFAMQREAAAARELGVEVGDTATVGDVWDAAVTLVPALAPGRETLRFAINGVYAGVTERVADGDEVAAIPPVSGGDGMDAPVPRGRVRVLEIHAAPFRATLTDELARRLATPEDGAVVTFVGRTRVTPGTPAPGQEAEAAKHAGARVEGLEYEAFEPMAIAVLGQIADEIEARFGVERLAIVHRSGPVPPEETSVIVVAVAPHRDAAFAAARYAIDETKARAPIWKAEQFADGRVWIGAPARLAADDEPPPAERRDDAG
jgi:molybdopterin synthase catalytic subunit/molybdopterin converting factor small subunit